MEFAKKFLFLLTVLAALLLSTAAFWQYAKTWTESNNSSWNNAFNWSPTGVPELWDNVLIPAGTTNQPVVSGITNAVANNLSFESGASLTIAATSNNEATRLGVWQVWKSVLRFRPPTKTPERAKPLRSSNVNPHWLHPLLCTGV